MEDLEIIKCKDCRHCKYKKVNDDSCIYSCTLDNVIEPDKPELYCNKKCFSKRLNKKHFNKKNKKLKKRK